jgi:hypothetical protein
MVMLSNCLSHLRSPGQRRIPGIEYRESVQVGRDGRRVSFVSKRAFVGERESSLLDMFPDLSAV